MRATPLLLMAVFPGMWDAPVPGLALAPCTLAVEIHVTAPLTLGTLELHAMAGEVDRVWRPYGLTLCWSQSDRGCEGLEVRLRVDIGEDESPPGTGRGRGPHVAGWIAFSGATPGTDIRLSAGVAQAIVSRARVGTKPLADWPAALGQRYVPRVLGRALAHEIGHYVLGTPAHTRNGLMATSIAPDRFALAETARFGLSASEQASVRSWCSAHASQRRAALTLDDGVSRVVVH